MQIKSKVLWDTSKPSGDRKRVMDIYRAKDIGFKSTISIKDGIREVMNWYEKNREVVGKRYNVFREDKTD